MTFLTSFLFSEYRRKVLALLLLHSDMQYHVREIARLTHTAAGSLHKELSKLAQAGVLIRKDSSHQVYYQANTLFPIYEDLANILRKTSGLADVLKQALFPHLKKIQASFVFGSVAQGKEHSASDIDLLIIGEITFTEAVKILYPVQTILAREINPKVYRKVEWNKLIQKKDSFAKDLLKKPKIFIVGELSDIK